MSSSSDEPRRRLYLMRHGEVAYFTGAGPTRRSVDGELTGRGRQQARAVGHTLRGVRFDKVVTSGLPRTRETAELVLRAADCPGIPDMESWPDFEEFRGTCIEAIDDEDVDEAFLPIFHGIPSRDQAFLGGESVGSVVDRVNRALDRLLEDRTWQTALLVLHGGVNRAIISRTLTGRPDFFGHIEQSPGALNIIDVGPGWYLRAVNTTPTDPAHTSGRRTSIEELAADYRAYRGWT